MQCPAIQNGQAADSDYYPTGWGVGLLSREQLWSGQNGSLLNAWECFGKIKNITVQNLL
jgi:hypothetical protein